MVPSKEQEMIEEEELPVAESQESLKNISSTLVDNLSMPQIEVKEILDTIADH